MANLVFVALVIAEFVYTYSQTVKQTDRQRIRQTDGQTDQSTIDPDIRDYIHFITIHLYTLWSLSRPLYFLHLHN